MKRFLSIFTAMALLVGFTACEEGTHNDTPNDQTPNVELKADKLSIVADGQDAVTFQVLVNGADRTAECQIINLEDNSILEGTTFTATEAGNYRFKAAFGATTSEYVTITATAVETPVEKSLRLAVDVKRIKADGQDKATFTVTYGEEDVTAKSEITVSQTSEVLEDATFTTTEVGAYTFRAHYNGMTSPYVSVEAYDPALVGKYEIGTIYDDGTNKGLIFAIKADKHGDTYCYIVSLDEEDLQWSTKYEWCNCMSTVGYYNTTDPFERWGMNIDDYPAFKWCMDHGDGWFMPSSTEVNWLWETLTNGERDFKAASVNEFNALLEKNGGEPFVETYYWTSNETSMDLIEVIAFMNDSVVCLDPKKDNVYTARAAYRFKLE